LSESGAQNATTLELRFPSDPRLLKTVRGLVNQMAALCGFAEEEAHFITLAVDEACANVMRHAYEGRTDGEVRLSCLADSAGIEFLVSDRGRAPLPSQIEGRSSDEAGPGGLGVQLIRSVMDKVSYRGGREGNQLYLAKSLRPQPRAESGAVLK
jgi:anti-sigma regulatory factor (Ser/Thr protein kinase)